MIAFYAVSLIPIIIGFVLFYISPKVNWKEWVGGSAIALFTSLIMHGIAFYGTTADIECWSGRITHVTYNPSWTEHYTETHTRTVGTGKNRHTQRYTDSHNQTHPEHWNAFMNYGEISDIKEISIPLFNEIKKNFGNTIDRTDTQPSSHGGYCIGGDRKCYTTINSTGYIYPTTITRHFTNRIKAAPTVFSFIKVPTNIPVHKWPENSNWMQSDRLINESRISILEFDRMNSRLGPHKFVNVIFINFGDKGRSMAEYQKAHWVGGKKNDIVLCYGQLNLNNVPSWSMVFGWSDSEICKRNLETILLEHPINDNILPLIEKEIKTGYTIKDWSQYDYISIDPPKWAWITLILVMLISQTCFWIWSHFNEFDKYGKTNYWKP